MDEQLEPATADQHSPILRLNGIPTPFEHGFIGDGFFREPMGSWRPISGDGLYDIDAECAELHNDLAAKIFGSIDKYYALLPVTPLFISQAGLNSEARVSQEAFERLLLDHASFPEINRLLYLYDVRALVSGVQECTKEVSQLTGEFYRILNLEPFFGAGIPVKDDVRWTTSPTVTKLTSTLGFVFIRMHSLLDYLAKLAREVEQLRTDFKSYPKLASSSFLFGQRKRLKINSAAGSLFEPSEEVAEVELIRNLIIHDGLLDEMPKAYEVIANGIAVERFVLLPDYKKGQFERFRNRHRFYGRDDKINLRLLALVRRFQARQIQTLKVIRELLS